MIPNRYGGRCKFCGQWVPANTGEYWRGQVSHLGKCPTEQEQKQILATTPRTREVFHGEEGEWWTIHYSRIVGADFYDYHFGEFTAWCRTLDECRELRHKWEDENAGRVVSEV